MKKIVSLLLVCAFFAGVVGSVSHSAPLSGIGYIDVQKVFKGYKETAKAQEQLSKQEADFKKDFEESQKKLEDAKTANKSQKDIESLTKELEEKLAPKREKLMQMNEALTSRLQKDIIGAVKDAAKNLGLDSVFDKQAVIYGGMDISDMVISKLNEK
jgi:outer membrane protein